MQVGIGELNMLATKAILMKYGLSIRWK